MVPTVGTGVPAWVIEGAAVATVDASGSEHASGHLVVSDGRIAAVGAGAAPASVVPGGARRVDGTGCLLTPGLVNAHHHFSQWLTRGMAPDSELFGWLTALYPWWGCVTDELEHAGALGALSVLAASGCTTTMDHQYVFPRHAGDLLAAEVEAAARVGLRFHPARGSMDLGRSAGGLPPDDVVEATDAALAATDEAIARFHDPSPGAMVRVAVAPCSPFSVSGELMTGAASLARTRGVRLHTHLAETTDEDLYCQDRYGCTPVQYAESLGWLGPDVWVAHGVHLDEASRARLGATGTGVAHCPSSNGRLGAGVAPVPELLAVGVPVALGVDGSASNESGELWVEVREALLVARARGGARALGTREVLRMATMTGARCLGRAEELGSLEQGKLADVALWRLDTVAHAGIADPVAALTLGARPPLALLLVGGRAVVEEGQLVTVDAASVAGEVKRAVRALGERHRASRSTMW
ncbi:MAG TPA: 8-oxoguanine deaminase [Acidimicrobiales bacterium]|nr:8-oxoguanine deaminase [Acidimicrobiales bacterium]